MRASWVPSPFSNLASISFNGTTSYVSATSNSAANPNFNTSFWCSWWMKTTQSSGTPTIFANLNGSTHGIYVWMNNSGLIEFGLWSGGGNTARAIMTGTAINDGVWHNIVVSNSGAGTGASWTCFVDGASKNLAVVTNTLASNTTTSSTDFTIGCDLTGGGASAADFYNGKINQWTFTQGATANSTTALAIYNRGVAGDLKRFSPGVWQYFIGAGDAFGTSTLIDRGTGGMNFTSHNMTSSTDYPYYVFNRQSMHFGGSANVDCGSNSTLQPETTDAFSCNFWVYNDVATYTADMTWVGNDPAASSGGWTISVNSGTFFPVGSINVELDAISPTANFGISTAGSFVPVRTWKNYGFSYTGSNSPAGLSLYDNGVLASTSTYGSTLAGTIKGGFSFTIGSENTAFPFTGYMSFVTYYNVALTAADHLALYNGGTPTSPAVLGSKFQNNCVSYWGFQAVNFGDTTSTVFDQKGSNNGTVTSGTYSYTVP